MIKFFWMPTEVWYYVIIPILVILLAYFVFSITYRKKKGTYYYNYVVDYVYSTLGILFCSLLLCLLLGYAIATIQTLVTTNTFKEHLFLIIIIAILPLIPVCFLVYIAKIYVKNLKRKEMLDIALDEYERGDVLLEKKNN